MKLIGINISKSFSQKQVLDNVSLELRSGDIFGLFGRNGSGKSTLLKILFGSVKASSGDFYLDDEAYKPYRSFERQLIAYLPQDSMYPKNIKVQDLIPLAIPNGEAQDKVFYAKGIERYTKKLVGNLSEGERTHLGLIISCNLPHPILLMDEPFSMTDPLTIELIKEEILDASKTKAVLISDHYYNDVLDVATKSAVLQNGQLQVISNRDDLQAYGYTN